MLTINHHRYDNDDDDDNFFQYFDTVGWVF